MTENIIVDGLDVSRETIEKLKALASLIEKWTKSINLIAPNSVPEIWSRHILDSAQIFEIADENWKNWVDLGSGGGLPALVVAILDPQQRPLTLVESDKRKCLFLSTARRELDLNVTVLNERIEHLILLGVDVLSARALAPLPMLISYADTLLAKDGTALFLKGARYQEEVDLAQNCWHFDMKEYPSKTNTESRILEISRIRRRES